MPLAGDLKIAVAIENDSGRPPGLARHQGREERWLCGLRFLAAERAAHAATNAHDLAVADAETVGHDGLDLGGVLGGGVNRYLAALARYSERRLGLQVKMLLAPAEE